MSFKKMHDRNCILMNFVFNGIKLNRVPFKQTLVDEKDAIAAFTFTDKKAKLSSSQWQ